MGRERTALLSNKYINTPSRCGFIGLFPTIAQIQAEHIVQMSGVFWLPILYAWDQQWQTLKKAPAYYE